MLSKFDIDDGDGDNHGEGIRLVMVIATMVYK